MEELLKIAKERFPEGTKFTSPYTFSNAVVSGNHYIASGDNICVVTTDNATKFLYFEGKWAKNLSKPEIEEKDFFEKAYTSLCKMQQTKDKKYGNSALSDKFNLFDGKTKLAPRLKDKLNRIDNSPVLIKNDVSDLIGYLMLVCKENNWDNFEDLID